jgi:hypothetical protein
MTRDGTRRELSRIRYGETECLRSTNVDDKLERGRLHDS